MFESFGSSDQAKILKSDMLVAWFESEWLPAHTNEDLAVVWVQEESVHAGALSRIDQDMDLGQGFKFKNVDEFSCPVVKRTESFDHRGEITYRTGGFIYTFASDDAEMKVLLLSTSYSDNGWHRVVMGAIPRDFLSVFAKFQLECFRLAYAMQPSEEVVIIGGRTKTFEPTVTWDEVVLPAELKEDLMGDVEAFFAKGVEVYKRLNLKPFRKLLLAGVPGTGKTMICSALAKWALAQGHLVIYVSSAHKGQDDPFGSTFDKIQHALSVASSSKLPTLLILEELDAYLHDEEKALILNVLDGSEASVNDMGTLLVSTTNYPEAIDERVLKRPGRLDRIFIVPEAQHEDDAEKMLRQYLGDMWHDDHLELVPHLVGFPGAFIREVAVFALTQVAYGDLDELPFDVLLDSFNRLKDQIEARDDFLKRKASMGLVSSSDRPFAFSNGNGRKRAIPPQRQRPRRLDDFSF